MIKPAARLLPAVLLLWVSACASGPGSGSSPFSTRFVEANERAAPQEIRRSGEDSVVRVTLVHALRPDGPGAWVQGAEWDEYVLAIENLSSFVVTLDTISVTDVRGVLVPREFHWQALRQKSAMLKAEYASVGSIAATNLAPQAALTGGVLMATFLPPVAIVLGGAALIAKSSKQQDELKIANEFGRRNIPIPAMVDSKGTIKGSAFFPVMPPPRALVVQYRNQQGLPVPVRVDLSGVLPTTEAAATRQAK